MNEKDYSKIELNILTSYTPYGASYSKSMWSLFLQQSKFGIEGDTDGFFYFQGIKLEKQVRVK